MLKYKLIHPELLSALGECGHGDAILLADSNFPSSSKAPAQAHIIYLNLAPGLLSATDILKVVLDAIPVEGAAVMLTDKGEEAPVVAEYRALLPAGLPVNQLGRFEFYDEVGGPKTMVVIATGEQRIYANLLLYMGVVAP